MSDKLSGKRSCVKCYLFKADIALQIVALVGFEYGTLVPQPCTVPVYYAVTATSNISQHNLMRLQSKTVPYVWLLAATKGPLRDTFKLRLKLFLSKIA